MPPFCKTTRPSSQQVACFSWPEDLHANSSQRPGEEGKIGLCGVESSNFFIFPLVCWIIQKIRPDVTVHPVVENAGSMLPHHLAAIKRCLGFRNRPEGAPIIDSKS
eukprot:1285822-Heterocapsa_arctica.AAC.1